MNPSVESFREERRQLLVALHAKYRSTAKAHPDQWTVHASDCGGAGSQASRIVHVNKVLEVGDQTALIALVMQLVKKEQAQWRSYGRKSSLLKPAQGVCVIMDEQLRWYANSDNDPYVFESELNGILQAHTLEEMRVLTQRYIDAVLPPYMELVFTLDVHMLDLIWQSVGMPALRNHPLFAELEPLLPKFKDIYRRSGLDLNQEFILASPYTLVEKRQEAMYLGDCDSVVVGRCEGDFYDVSVQQDMTLEVSKGVDIIPNDVGVEDDE